MTLRARCPALLAAALLAAGPAAADLFYCGARAPESLFEEAQASSDAYVVLFGRFATEVSLSYLDGEPRPPFPARFEGHSLTAQGFTAPVAPEVTVAQACREVFGVTMCGDLGGASHPVLLFARRAADGRLEVEVGPCGQWAQTVASGEAEGVAARLAACARGACPAP
jgi:hypothetical protein